MTQKQAIEVMLSGANLFLTGPPGSGKTYLLKKFIETAKQSGKNVAVTATTGIASTHLDGATIHSWAGIGISSKLSTKDYSRLISQQSITSRYKQTDILVIDEVSMLDGLRLDLINELAKNFRMSDKPMGGMQLVLVGDFFQLPPSGNDFNSYIFKSKTWKELDIKICYLSEQYRQTAGDELNLILQAIRYNRLKEAEKDILRSKIDPKPPHKSNIIRLYSHNFDAEQLNKQKLDSLNTKERLYKTNYRGSRFALKALSETMLSPAVLRLKIGSEVIFTANNYREGYVNGDRGRVVDFKSGWPVVRMIRDSYIIVRQHNWRIEVNKQVFGEAWQLPLKLAWAITIHKSQGMTLAEAIIDLRRTFSPSMGYVALSRLRNIDGLYLLGLNAVSLKVDPRLLRVDSILRAQSDKLMIR